MSSWPVPSGAAFFPPICAETADGNELIEARIDLAKALTGTLDVFSHGRFIEIAADPLCQNAPRELTSFRSDEGFHDAILAPGEPQTLALEHDFLTLGYRDVAELDRLDAGEIETAMRAHFHGNFH